MSEDLPGIVLPVERRLRIAAQLRRDTRVRVEDLVGQFAVSGETIRRDLQVLEERGMARRVYGGAVAQHSPSWQLAAEDRHVARVDPRRAIAALAATLVEPADTLVIDSGVTAAEVGRALPASFAGRVLCCSLPIAAELAARDGVEVHLCGGLLDGGELSCTGPNAERFFEEFFADRAFIAVGGVHPQAGVTGSDLPGNVVRQVILRQARDCYVLAEHWMLGRIAVGRLCGLKGLAGVITDSGADDETVSALEEAGATVLVAPPLTAAELPAPGASSFSGGCRRARRRSRRPPWRRRRPARSRCRG
jgi:DeoR/GlpR family transcriptional regulator of sugar metabolism